MAGGQLVIMAQIADEISRGLANECKPVVARYSSRIAITIGSGCYATPLVPSLIWQEITNAHDIPPWRSQRDCNIAVTARLVWERDGVELIATTAYAWSGDFLRAR
jgi:hypothetical protein